MSFEDAVTDLTKAIREQTEVLRGGIAKATGAASTAAGTAARSAGRPAGSPNKPKIPSLADIKTAFGDYIGSVPKTDKAARTKITDNVKAILNHFGVDQASLIPEENRAEAIGYVQQFVAGETPSFMDEGDGGEALV